MKKPTVVHGLGVRGIRGLDRAAWVALASTAVHDLVNTRLAVPHVELEARLWDTTWEEPGTTRLAAFFPHILSSAVGHLTSQGIIVPRYHVTKGSTAVELLTPADTRKRTTAIDQAVRRKGMLYARFLRWSHTEFGPAGEHVVRASLIDQMQLGYAPMTTHFGEVAVIGTVRIPGALDSGAWMQAKDPATRIPTTHAVLFEIKNRRVTLYPRHPEVYQLLFKAATLRAAIPLLPIVPVLICRRAHKWLFWMARDLGFIVHDARQQYLTLPEKTDIRLLEEVRKEFGLSDLRLVSRDHQPRIINLFAETLPAQARKVAIRWSTVGATLLERYRILRNEKIKPWDRTSLVSELRTAAEQALADAGIPEAEQILAWALEETLDDVGY